MQHRAFCVLPSTSFDAAYCNGVQCVSSSSFWPCTSSHIFSSLNYDHTPWPITACLSQVFPSITLAHICQRMEVSTHEMWCKTKHWFLSCAWCFHVAMVKIKGDGSDAHKLSRLLPNAFYHSDYGHSWIALSFAWFICLWGNRPDNHLLHPTCHCLIVGLN